MIKIKKHAWTIREYLILLLILVIFYAFLAIFIKDTFEGDTINFLQALYFVIITMTTVGYGDIIFTSPIGQIFTIIVALSGVIMLFALLFPFVVMPWIESSIKGELPEKLQKKIENHIIVCGYNTMVESLVHELEDHNMPFLVIDENEHQIRTLIKDGIICIFGDPSEEKVLEAAGIDSAKMLVANQSDEKNASIVLTAREFSRVEIIAIVENKKNADYLKYAGANRVISPKALLGSFIGRKAVAPLTDRITNSIHFMDDLEITEFPIYPGSQLLRKTLMESRIRELTGANIVGLWKGGELSLNPKSYDVIKRNSILLAVGNKEQLKRLKRLTH
jgi:voltage-gated potassium channel